MNCEQPQYEIKTSVMALGIAYAASLIRLIVWIACARTEPPELRSLSSQFLFG